MITYNEEEKNELTPTDGKFTTDGKFPDYQAFRVLHTGYSVLPIIAGADKFFHFLADWDRYLAPIIPATLGIPAETLMLGVGVVEIMAGLICAMRPRLGGYLIAFWFWGIIINLLLIPGFFDIALRDFGLSLGAWALAKLAEEFE